MAWVFIIMFFIAWFIYITIQSSAEQEKNRVLNSRKESLKLSLEQQIKDSESSTRENVTSKELEFSNDTTLEERRNNELQSLKQLSLKWVTYVEAENKKVQESIGNLKFTSDILQNTVVVPLVKIDSFLLKSDTGSASLNTYLNTLAYKFLKYLPAGTMKFLFLDPVGLGQNAAIFMRLADYDESLVTNRVWSETQHIRRYRKLG